MVSGVGHEVDTTLCDLVADERASTPSNAAEIVFPDRRELRGRVNLIRSGLIRAASGELQKAEIRFRDVFQRLSALSPEKRISLLMNRQELARVRLCSAMDAGLENAAGSLKETGTLLRQAAAARVKDAGHCMERLRERLTAVNPLAVLNRGYAMVYDREEHLLTRAADAAEKEEMTLQFADGRIAVSRKETI